MLKATTSLSPDRLTAFLLKAEAHLMECIKQALINLCNECDEKARERGEEESFHNVSGNLRSSMGGAVYENGMVIFSTAFNQVLGGSVGSAEGRRKIEEMAGMYVNAVAMTYVAAMDYAKKVEALDSKDVIESVRLYSESVVGSRLEEAKDKAMAEINSWKI